MLTFNLVCLSEEIDDSSHMEVFPIWSLSIDSQSSALLSVMCVCVCMTYSEEVDSSPDNGEDRCADDQVVRVLHRDDVA